MILKYCGKNILLDKIGGEEVAEESMEQFNTFIYSLK